ELMDHIIQSTNEFVKDYGPVKMKDFSVVLVATKDDFIRQTKGHSPEWSIAVAMPGLSKVVLQSPAITHMSMSRFMDVVVHELNHIFVYRIKNSATFPAWFIEGLAMRSSGEFSILYKLRISQAKWRNQLIPLSRLYSMQTQATQSVNLAYGQSAAAVDAMEYFYGQSVFSLIFETMDHSVKSGRHVDFYSAFKKTTGDDQLDFQEKYLDFIRQNYNWLFLVEISSIIFVLLPIIVTGGYFYKRYRNKKKLQLWELEEALEELGISGDQFNSENNLPN
ncbi:MAG: peptidase MA family metallohydrolase, partial [Fidelibacterota bacterium]